MCDTDADCTITGFTCMDGNNHTPGEPSEPQ
jgi:hypothetical protein